MSITLLAFIFITIALIYSSVGFGGGSSYIAILLLGGLAIQDVRFIALVCNICVVFGASIHYWKAGLINTKKILPIVILSVPFAFLGGMIELENEDFKLIAAVALMIAAILMLTKVKISEQRDNIPNSGLGGIGGSIGFLSGLIGIGGGIFLAPILHLINWDQAKNISAAASLFILVNSIAGLAGQLTNRITVNIQHLFILALCVVIGGQIGNHLNIHVLKPDKIRLLTALLVGFVGIRIIITHFN